MVGCMGVSGCGWVRVGTGMAVCVVGTGRVGGRVRQRPCRVGSMAHIFTSSVYLRYGGRKSAWAEMPGWKTISFDLTCCAAVRVGECRGVQLEQELSAPVVDGKGEA